MKRKITFLIAAIAAILLITQPVKVVGQRTITWERTDPSSLATDDIIVVVDLTSSKAMSNNNGSSSAPSASSVTLNTDKDRITSTVASTIQWTLTTSGTGSSRTYQLANGDDYLYVTAANNGVRVGDGTRNTFTLKTGGDNNGYYFYNKGKNNSNQDDERYIGCYNSSDWRCYTSINNNIKGNDIVFFKKVSSVPSVTAPTIAGAGGVTVFDNSLDVTITPASGTTMYYTTDGTTPSSSTGTGYTSAQVINITATTTVKAIAYDNSSNPSSVTSVTFNKSLTTMDEIFAKATALGTQGGSVYISFNNWVVSGVSGDNAFVTDGTKGFIIYKSSHGLTVGKVLTGSKVQCTLKMYKGSAEITSWGSGFTTTTGGTVTEQETTIDELSGVNTGSLIQLNHVTYNGTNLVDDNDHIIKPYTTLFSSVLSYLSNGHTYNIIGVYQQYEDEEPHNILARSSADITEVHDPTITVSPTTNLAVPNYIQGTPVENIGTGTLTVGGTYLTHNITVALVKGASSDFEIYDAANTEWTHTLTLSKTNQTVSNTNISVRLKSGKTAGNYSDNINITSEDATSKSVAVTGSVTNINVTYDANNADSGTAPSDATNYNYNSTVTVLDNNGNLDKDGYTFGGWNTQADGLGTNYTAGNTFSITSNTTLYAKWNAKSYTISKSDMTGGSITVKIDNDEVTSATTGATVTLVVAPAANHALSTLTVTKSPSGSVTLSPTVSSSVLTYTFTMPASDVTVAAAFVEKYSLDVDFESALNTYTYWDFTNITKRTNSSKALISPHSGTGYGVNSANGTNGTTTAAIATTYKIKNPCKLTCYISKESNNTTSSTWKIQTSTDNETWTDRASASASDASMDNGAKWNELSFDLSTASLTNVYVRVYYTGNNALRCIDDISLEYTPAPYGVAVDDVTDGTITATEGVISITNGENANIEAGRTVTLSAEGDATHMFSAWNVTETVSGNTVTVTDNKFVMPACAVTVSAEFEAAAVFTYNVNGNTFTKKYATGSSVVLPTQSEYTPEGYGITGWTETEGNVASPVTSSTASTNKIFYAIMGKTVYSDFALVESAPSNWSGLYLIVYKNNDDSKVVALNTHYGALNTDTYGTDADVKDYYSSKVISFNSTTSQYMVTIAKTTNGYSIYDTDGYLGNIDNSTGSELRWDTEFTANQNEWTLGVNSIVGVKNSSKAIRYNTGSPRFAIYGTSDQAAIQLYKTTVSYEGAYTHIYPSNSTATGNINVGTTGPIVIENGGTLNMGDNTLTCTDPTKLIIEDGAQLILKDNNTSVQATVKKSVTTWTGDVASKDDPVNDGWQTISTSTRDDEDGSTIAFSNVDNLVYLDNTTPRYNVYTYDEANILWVNNLASAPYGFSTLKVGQGYIYRTGGSTDLEYKGYVNTGDIDIDLKHDCSTPGFEGFNLIGNPYTHSIYKGGTGSAIVNGSLLEAKYYALNLTTGTFELTNDGTEIPKGTAIMVQAKDEGKLTMKNLSVYVAPAKAGNDNIWFTVKNENFQDFACVDFKPGRGLNKINHYNEDAPMLYINHNGENFGAVNMSDDTKSINLNFKAMTMGKYTLSLKPEGNFNYIHVIDKLTGEDVDMLLEGEYSFIASPMDADNRFVVRLGYQPDYGNDDDIFAYQSGNDIYVTGNGELQIFDVTGRRVMNTTINGMESINIPAQGVYIFRLNEKVQKIVVR